MNLSAIIIFLGAAWNAEAASIRASRAVPSRPAAPYIDSHFSRGV
jgi:uncharacterized BrkB/YihY/UPF0761 family membrane protein